MKSHFDCGCRRLGAPERPWPDYCAPHTAEAYSEFKSQLWAHARTLGVLLVWLWFLIALVAK